MQYNGEQKVKVALFVSHTKATMNKPYGLRYQTSSSGAPARGGHGGQPLTLEKIRLGYAHPGNTNRGLKTFRQ